MKMRAFALLVVMGFAGAGDLKPSKDAALASVLGLQREIASSPVPSESLYWARVFAVPTQIGECGGTVESCPDVRLMISVGTGDLGERPVLYELPKAKGWEFVQWRTHGPAGATGMVVRTKLPDANISIAERSNWRATEYSVWLATEKARFERR